MQVFSLFLSSHFCIFLRIFFEIFYDIKIPALVIKLFLVYTTSDILKFGNIKITINFAEQNLTTNTIE